MAFDAGNIVARLKLDRKEFKAGLDTSKRDVLHWDRALGATLRGGAFVAAIGFATKKLFDFTANAARLETMNQAFDRMAGGVQRANALLSKTRLVTRSIAEQELKEAANQLELLGVGMDKLPRFVEIARSAAIGLRQDVGFMLRSLSTGTARQSRLWLDNLGIIISVEEAQEEYARALGKTVKELTDTEERAAFLNAVLTRGQDIIDKVGASSETSTEKVLSLGAAFRDLADAINTLVIRSKLPDVMASLAGMLRGEIPLITPLGIFGRGGGPPGGRDEFSPDARAGVFGSRNRALEAAVAAQQAARAYFLSLQSTLGGANQLRRGREPVNSFIPFDWGEVSDPGLSFGEPIVSQFDLIRQGVSSLGDAFGGLFEFLITDSAQAGRAFFSGIMSGLSGIASSLGEFYIQMGIGTLAIQTLNPFAAIAAGLALKALSGIMRGIAFNNAPITSSASRSLRNPLRRGDELQGSTTIIVQGDFIGDRVWVDRLMQMIRMQQRNTGQTIVHQGAR